MAPPPERGAIVINPSRLRREEAPADAAFTLHLRTAGRLALARRGTRAALGALLASCAATLVAARFGMPLPYHLAAVLLGGLAGALAPLAPPTREALAHISRRTGWAYEAALELLARRASASAAGGGAALAGDEADEFGLEADLLARARRAVADYSPAPTPRWWLPLAVAALALTALPPLLRAAAPAAPTHSTADSTSGSTDSSPFSPADDLLGLPRTAGRAEDPAAAGAASGRVDAPDVAPPAGAGGDGDALSRYLEALRQGQGSSAPPGAAGAAGGAAGGGAGQGGEGAATPPAGRAPAGFEPGRATGAAGGGSAAAGAPAAPDRESNAAGEAAAEPGADEGPGDEAAGGTGTSAGAAGDGETDQPGRSAAQPGERAVDAGTPGEVGGPEGSAAGLGATGPARSEGAAAASASGGEDDALTPGSAGAGGAALADDASATGSVGTGAVQLLPGVIRGGPTTPAGSVRLPGDDQVELPPGTPLAPYRTAAEEALGEGDLPAAYQEIIRRYFR